MMGMTNQTDSIRPVVEIQRRLLDENQQLLRRSVEAQQLTNGLVRIGLENQRAVQRYGIEAASMAAHGYIDSITTATPGESDADHMHNLDEQFGQLLGVHDTLFGALTGQFERSADAYEDLSEEYIDSFDEQFDSLLDTHHQFETQTIR